MTSVTATNTGPDTPVGEGANRGLVQEQVRRDLATDVEPAEQPDLVITNSFQWGKPGYILPEKQRSVSRIG